jgi:diguanylate cyclase (GGDEF)-like protein
MVAAVIAVPLLDYLLRRQYAVGYLQTLANTSARRIVEQVITRNPEDWEFEHARLRGLLVRERLNLQRTPMETVYDRDGEVVFESGPCHPPPCLRVRADLLDAGVKVGTLELALGQRPLLKQTLVVGVVSSALGLLAILLFVYFPMRAWQRAEARTRFLAEHDALTGVLNRYAAVAVFEREQASASRYDLPLSLLLLDIDHFKRINDRYGHGRGDDVLRRLTSLLAESIRASDVLVRWGGEEFVIIAPHTDPAGAAELAEKLRETVEETNFPIPEVVTISLGVAQSRPRDTLRTVADRADAALYRAKTEGRNRWVADDASTAASS